MEERMAYAWRMAGCGEDDLTPCPVTIGGAIQDKLYSAEQQTISRDTTYGPIVKILYLLRTCLVVIHEKNI